MRIYAILHIIGFLLLFEGICILATGIGTLFGNMQVGVGIVYSGLFVIIVSLFLIFLTPKTENVNIRESLLIVVLGWMITSFSGALPYIFTGTIPSVTNALFESVSGFTTTGSSILSNIEALPKGILFWRSLTHFLGGVGILILVLMILPLTGGGGMILLKTEHTFLVSEKVVPTLSGWFKRILIIYFGLIALESVLLVVAGMSVFDAVTHSFGTIATGGFSTRNLSIASFNNVYIEIIIMVFMFAGGVSFAIYYKIAHGKVREMIGRDDLRFYFIFIVISIALITFINWSGYYHSIGKSLRYSSFQVISINSTTGFGSADYEQWPVFSRIYLIILMLIGASAGSTSGAIKNFRIIIFWRCILREIKNTIHPSGVFIVRYNKKKIAENRIYQALIYILVYLFVFATVIMLLLILGNDFLTSFSASATTLGGVGPGLGMIGPLENFALLSAASKWILIASMLLGRLEIFSFFIIFSSPFWKQTSIKWKKNYRR